MIRRTGHVSPSHRERPGIRRLRAGWVIVMGMFSTAIAADESLRVRRADLTEYRACGPTCLYLVFRMFGIDAALDEVNRSVDADGDELSSFADLASAAREKRLAVLAANLASDELAAVPGPAILHVRSSRDTPSGVGDHFTIYLGQSRSGEIELLEAPRSPVRVPRAGLDAWWTGNVLVFARSEAELAEVRKALESQRASRIPVALLVIMPILLAAAVGLWMPTFARWAKSAATLVFGRRRRVEVAVLVLAALAAGGCGDAGTARFTVDEVVPFGVIALQAHEAEVPFRNLGTAPLQILSVRAQCNCTVPEATESTAPGAEGKITVKMRVVPPGPGSARLLVYSNDPSSPHEVYVRWFGEYLPALAPTAISRDDLAEGATFEQLVRIIYAGGDPDQPMTVSTADSSNPEIVLKPADSLITATYNRVGEAMNQIAVAGEIAYLITCRLPSTGEVVGECRFSVEQAGETHSLVLPVRLAVGARLSASPDRLTFSRVGQASFIGLKKQIVLTVRGDEDPKIVSSPEFLRCTLQKNEGVSKDRRAIYFLVAEITKSPPLADEGPVGKIEVATAGTTGEPVRVPVYALAIP